MFFWGGRWAAWALALAWRCHVASSRQLAERTTVILQAYLDEERTAVADTTAALRSLATLPGIGTPGVCANAGGMLLRLDARRLDGFALSAGDDPSRPVCQLGPGSTLAREALAPIRIGQSLRDNGPRRDRGDRSVMAVGVSAPDARGDTVSMAAILRLGSIDQPAAPESGPGLWLVGDDGGLHPLCPACGGVPPPSPAVLRRLIAGDGPQLDTGRRGATRVVTIGSLDDGRRVIAAGRVTADEARVTALLVRRFVAITLLLLLGLGVVATGAHVTVSAPVRALTRRVRAWQASGELDQSPMRFVTSELAALVGAFGAATDALAEREAQLRRATTEQDLLIKEIHHRVKNNLQIIASLLNLQASRIRAPEAKAEFEAARDRVRALATLHRHLYSEGGLHTIAMRPFLLELCGQLFQAMGEREGRRIQLDVEAPELEMSSDQAVPLALVVTEAVSNAVKYAFPGGRHGHVIVRLRRLDEHRIELLIQDDGIGIPAGRAETETGIRDGLGLQLIRGFARQLGATLVITEDGGTRTLLTLALRVERPGHEAVATAAM